MDGPENPVSAAGDSPGSLASLTEEERATALERFRVIQPHLEQGLFLTEVAAATGILYRTLSRWVSLYRRMGLAALVRRGRTDKGNRRGFAPRIPEAVEGLALRRPKLPVATIHRKIRQLAPGTGGKATRI